MDWSRLDERKVALAAGVLVLVLLLAWGMGRLFSPAQTAPGPERAPAASSLEQDPAQVCEIFLRQVRLGSVDQACDLLTARLQGEMTRPVFRRRVAAFMQVQLQRWGLQYRHVALQRQTGDSAVVEVRPGADDHWGQVWVWTLRREPAAWRIDVLSGGPGSQAPLPAGSP